LRLTRATLAVATGALASTLLLATPSLAAGTPHPSAAASSVPVAAAASDPGSVYDGMDEDDLRIAILRILGNPASGKRVTREADELLDNGTAEEMRAWLETGYRLAQAEDDRVAVFTMLADPGISDAMRQAIYAVLDDGTPEALRQFIEVGQYEVDG
jgi:hypothetical protein